MSASADLIALAASFGATCVSVPIVSKIAQKYGLYDPSGPLKIHTTPTPRLGGIGIGLSLILGISIAGPRVAGVALLGVAFALVWFAGIMDDLFGVPVIVRLFVQVFAGALLWFAGWSVPIRSASLSLALTVLIVVCYTNALNMLDGADGLAAGVSCFIAVGFLLTTTDPWSRALEFSLLGAGLSFLLFNFPPAKIFMGDSGSNVLGFLIGALTLNFYRRGFTNGIASVMAPLLFAAVPLLDAAFAVARRLSRRASPFEGDRGHFYDMLLQSGWSAREVAFTTYGLTAAFVALGLICRIL